MTTPTPKKYPAIPQPTADTKSLFETALAKKQILETLLGQRGSDKSAAAVTWQDLVNMGIITQSQVPGAANASTTPQPALATQAGLASAVGAVTSFAPLLSGTASSVANLDIDLGTLINSFRTFKIILTDFADSADGNTVIRCSTDGGVTFDSGSNYDFWYDYLDSTATYVDNHGLAQTSAIIGWGASNALFGSGFVLDCFNLRSTTNYKKFASYGTLGSLTTMYNFRGSANYKSTTAVNAIRFLASGNISCNWSVYGFQ